MSKASQDKLKSQKIVFLVLLTGISVGVGGVLWYALKDDLASKPKPKAQITQLPSDTINEQELWMNEVESKTTLTESRLKFLEETLLSQKKQEESQEKENTYLRNELKNLKKQLEEIPPPPEPVVIRPPPEPLPLPVEPVLEKLPILPPHKPIFLEEYEQTIEKPSELSKVKHVEKTIPAGTTVKALLVSSVDAPCGVNSSSDPQPIKLRLLDDGKLPKSVSAKLKGGLLIGSAYGNLSNERVYIRLERMTNIELSGEFVETDVTGFVSGEDGKFGVRGVMVDKSGQMITSAAFTGFLGGISQYLQSSINAQNLSRSTKDLPSNTQWDILSKSSAQGTTSAMDKLAEYYIQRAEQLLPVIQVAAGRTVDITFTHGADIGDLHTKEKVQEIRERSRKHG